MTIDVIELIQALIRNACVNDGVSGSEVRSVETLEAVLGPSDMKWEPLPDRVSALWRVPGTDPDAPSLTLMGHTDVVPVSPDGWSVDPFGAEELDGFIWGRGAIDMLNLTSAMAVVFGEHLRGERPRLPGDLVFLAVADEEAAGVHGAQYLVGHHWDTIRTDYLLTEIALPALETGRGRGLPVTVAEKGPHWRRIRAAGTPGHGSQPYGADNALIPIAEAMARLGSAPSPVAITPEWRRFVESWGLDEETSAALVDPDRVDDAIERLAVDDVGVARWAHACTHMTISPNLLRAGVKANVVADAAMGEIDIRLVPGQESADIDDHFRKVIDPATMDSLEVEPLESTPANGSLPEGPLWEAMGQALRSLRGEDHHLMPAMIPVATDARFFRSRGTVAYGVGLFDDRVGFGDLLRMFHGHDERVSVSSLRDTVEMLRRTVEAFGELSR